MNDDLNIGSGAGFGTIRRRDGRVWKEVSMCPDPPTFVRCVISIAPFGEMRFQ